MGSIGEEAVINHPYIPSDLKLPGFVPNQLSMSDVVAVYLLATFLAVLVTWIVSGFIKKISKLERTIMCWWMVNGLSHIILELYYVLTPEFYKEKSRFYLAEIWKEYSKGDSRYIARDSVSVSVEGIASMFVGPLALLVLYAIATKKSYRYVLQLVLSVVHLYGTILYYVTAVLDGDNFSISPFYYYSYYFIPNIFWIVIPAAISIYCWNKMNAAVHYQDQELNKVKRR